MQAYQLAVTEGGFADLHESRTTIGAELVYLGSDAVGVTKREQPKIVVEDVKDEIIEIAEAMSGKEFFATINKRCKKCPVRSACPIQSDGRAVMQ